MEKGVPIRSVSRSLAVLRAINQHGRMSITEIANMADVPYPTACRIVQTLLHEGMIERETQKKYYRPTELVKTLSHGYNGETLLAVTARPLMVDLTRRLLWPLILTTRVGAVMMVRESTHSLTSLALGEYQHGYSFPLFECASGRLQIVYADAQERRALLDGAQLSLGYRHPLADSLDENGLLFNEIRDAGYACGKRSRFSNTPGKTSSISAPILIDGRMEGALSIDYIACAMRDEEALERFAGLIVDCAQKIAEAYAKAAERIS